MSPNYMEIRYKPIEIFVNQCKIIRLEKNHKRIFYCFGTFSGDNLGLIELKSGARGRNQSRC